MCDSYVYKRRKLRCSLDHLPQQSDVGNFNHQSCNSDFLYGPLQHNMLAKEKDDSNLPESISLPISTNETESTDHKEVPSNNENSKFPPSDTPKNKQPNPENSQGDCSVILALESVPRDANGLPVTYKRKRKRYDQLEQIGEEGGCSSLSKEFCINVLKQNNLIGGSWPFNNDTSLEILGGIGAEFHQKCKICGIKQSFRKMLICDSCDEAFHLSCSKVKGSFEEKWFCQTCAMKKPRPVLDAASEKLFSNMSEQDKKRILQKELGPIQFMLIDSQPHTSTVRIGKDFQVDIPEWSGRIPEYVSTIFCFIDIFDYDCVNFISVILVSINCISILITFTQMISS